MDHTGKITLLAALLEIASCTIAGLTYMDSLNLAPSKPPKGEDPCNPLYWYPRHIPVYCNGLKLDIPPAPVPLPMPPPPPPPPAPPAPPAPPIPLPPLPMPVPMPVYVPIPGPPPMPLPMPGPVPVPVPISPYAPGPLPVGIPGYQTYPAPAIQHGLSPNVDGLVSPDGALNILPFSDAYSDLLEKHKQKMIRIRLQNLLDEYEYYPRKSRRRCHRKNGCKGWRHYHH